MNAEEMQYQFLDTGWFDHEDRPKTALAMQHLVERAPDEVLDELDATVFAPSPDIFGQVKPGTIAFKSFIYLAPIIEEKSQEEVDFIVAHEFAHAYLAHEQAVRNADTIEDEADALAVEWGFVLPERRRKVEPQARRQEERQEGNTEPTVVGNNGTVATFSDGTKALNSRLMSEYGYSQALQPSAFINIFKIGRTKTEICAILKDANLVALAAQADGEAIGSHLATDKIGPSRFRLR